MQRWAEQNNCCLILGTLELGLAWDWKNQGIETSFEHLPSSNQTWLARKSPFSSMCFPAINLHGAFSIATFDHPKVHDFSGRIDLLHVSCSRVCLLKTCHWQTKINQEKTVISSGILSVGTDPVVSTMLANWYEYTNDIGRPRAWESSNSRPKSLKTCLYLNIGPESSAYIINCDYFWLSTGYLFEGIIAPIGRWVYFSWPNLAIANVRGPCMIPPPVLWKRLLYKWKTLKLRDIVNTI